MTTRHEFLDRVRQAVRQGNRVGQSAPLPARGGLGYQGGGPDPVQRFRDELAAAGGFAWVVASRQAAADTVVQLVKQKGARQALVQGDLVGQLGLPDRLRTQGVEVVRPEDAPPVKRRDTLFAADIGITGVEYLIAETGSVVHASKPADPRSGSLLPPIHIAVAERSQLLPDLFDLLERLQPGGGPPVMPAGLTIITGPSKTGDIELKLVTGVHGPGEIHVVLIDEAGQ